MPRKAKGPEPFKFGLVPIVNVMPTANEQAWIVKSGFQGVYVVTFEDVDGERSVHEMTASEILTRFGESVAAMVAGVLGQDE